MLSCENPGARKVYDGRARAALFNWVDQNATKLK
jgi:hypothetical protein